MGPETISPPNPCLMALDLLVMVVQDRVFAAFSAHLAAYVSPEIYFMAIAFSRPVSAGKVPIHVLVVVIGKYETDQHALHGAGQLANDCVDAWRTGTIVPAPCKELGSIAVLASDPKGAVRVTGDFGLIAAGGTTRESCVTAMRDWVSRIADSGGIGVLHWSGHGFSRSENGKEGVSLICSNDDFGDLDGVDWPGTVRFLDSHSNGRPIHCFIDACRVREANGLIFNPIGKSNPRAKKTTQSYISCSEDESTFWVSPGHEKPLAPEFEGHAIGTRAFIAALISYGARIGDLNSSTHLTFPWELTLAANGLISMWAEYYNISADTAPRMNDADYETNLAEISAVKCVAQIIPSFDPSDEYCYAWNGNARSKAVRSESRSTPYHFPLDRMPHVFRFDSCSWSREIKLSQPRSEHTI